MKNFVELILHSSPDKSRPALAAEGISLSYEDLKNSVHEATNFLQERGAKKQDRIIVSLGNSVENIILHYAIILAGAISVPLPSDLTEERLNFFIRDLDAKIIFTKSEFKSEKIIKISDYANLVSLLSRHNNQLENNFDVDAKDLASIMYTTGTTGIPKGVCLTHASVNQALKNIINYVGYDSSQKEVVSLPIYHNFGLGHIYCSHLTGGAVFIQDGIKSPKSFFKVFESGEYNGTPLTPSMLKILLGRYREKFIPILQKLSYVVVNSEPLPEEITKDIVGNCPSLKLMFYYGLTEASRSTFITLSDEEENYYKSVGKPTSENVRIKIIDGEICISGDHLFQKYWNNIIENNIIDDWFKTGDLGLIDQRGYLFITGRKKDQINIGGLKISTSEIAKIIQEISGVKELSVVAIPHETLGEVPAVLIVADEKLHANDIIFYCKKYLEIFAVPKKIVFSSFIPKAETGKILTDEVKKIILSHD